MLNGLLQKTPKSVFPAPHCHVSVSMLPKTDAHAPHEEFPPLMITVSSFQCGRRRQKSGGREIYLKQLEGGEKSASLRQWQHQNWNVRYVQHCGVRVCRGTLLHGVSGVGTEAILSFRALVASVKNNTHDGGNDTQSDDGADDRNENDPP